MTNDKFDVCPRSRNYTRVVARQILIVLKFCGAKPEEGIMGGYGDLEFSPF